MLRTHNSTTVSHGTCRCLPAYPAVSYASAISGARAGRFCGVEGGGLGAEGVAAMLLSRYGLPGFQLFRADRDTELSGKTKGADIRPSLRFPAAVHLKKQKSGGTQPSSNRRRRLALDAGSQAPSCGPRGRSRYEL
ncbi:hypothetical protein COCON_G00036680 [Conger conger]|uniref:Uncharacterized protein n=1 Tax=Conger conger TaxID=82655 RepID=A0A9Q1I7T9_CONCO|nr:hypothetical protein COCON_G00036680 [Conger conger]